MKYQFESTKDLLKFLNENLLSTVEAAELLGISKSRIGHMVRDGKLTPAKDQPKVFLKESVLERKAEQEELRKKYRPYDELE
ncbi:helix-turn-helix domain-containing protein [Bacillus sp. FJAT-49732]|uniref:Helix-turn-helix domain-containing protein n=1 Tax=Lederbergia citrisecunda TaxID=2833583 RepID=A0A942TK72_9BACI|nr:helix-turn-helix domain-containing protein [Lederbergia citrisecunda]MBS4198628.1 helix-turn-helix domain-containing protein [Lederbergia citrisecunda]